MSSRRPLSCETTILAIFMLLVKMAELYAALKICQRGEHKRLGTAIIGLALMSSSPAIVSLFKELRKQDFKFAAWRQKNLINHSEKYIYLSLASSYMDAMMHRTLKKMWITFVGNRILAIFNTIENKCTRHVYCCTVYCWELVLGFLLHPKFSWRHFIERDIYSYRTLFVPSKDPRIVYSLFACIRFVESGRLVVQISRIVYFCRLLFYAVHEWTGASLTFCVFWLDVKGTHSNSFVLPNGEIHHNMCCGFSSL